MAKKNRTTRQRFQNASSFQDQLRLALEFHDAPGILALHSPLATPYFLSSTVDLEVSDSPIDWGQVLSTEIDRTAALLWNGTPPESLSELIEAVETEAEETRSRRYDFLVLELNYFKHIVRPRPRNQAEIYNDVLHISRSTHDRHLKEAVERLGESLLQRLRPTVRLESPMLRSTLIGRMEMREESLQALKEGLNVSLVGVGGAGKTTLGTWLADHWMRTDVFWYTIRPHFNDQLSSLLFVLGYFLHRQGASGLWLQLVADGGKVGDPNLALGLALADIEMLPRSPLFCFDEIDMLRASDPEHENPHHVQILDFVNGLRHHTSLLCIGQRAILESDLILTLDRLSQSEIEEWLQHEGIAYSQDDLVQIESYTSGNPRLLTLCLALHRTLNQPELAETLVQLPHTPALAPIWDRLRKRLQPEQRQLLYALSVFRDMVPQDAWQGSEQNENLNGQKTGDPIDTLIQHHLIQEDGMGGVALLLTLRGLIYNDLSAERRDALHLNAAYICAKRGEITESAYHFWKGDKPEQAVQLWYPQRRTEIERGFAGTALNIFLQISANRLKPKFKRQLALLRAELYDSTGEPEKLVDSLESVEWPQDSIESIEAMHLWGVGLHTQGNSGEAQERLREGIDIIAYLLNKYAQLHVRRGTIYMHQREARDAWREANLARYYAEHLHGTIQQQLGNYETAQRHYQLALELANELDDLDATARAQYYLGIVASRHQDFSTAFQYFDSAIENYGSMGNRTQEMYVRSNFAATQLYAGDYHSAIKEAQQALSFYERTNFPYWIGLNAGNLAEAYFELGDLTNAEIYAFKTTEQEEANSFAYGLWMLGRVRHMQDRYDEAIQLLAQAIQIAQEYEDRWQTAYCRRTLGEVYAEQGDLDSAQQELDAALALFQEMALTAEVEKTETILNRIS